MIEFFFIFLQLLFFICAFSNFPRMHIGNFSIGDKNYFIVNICISCILFINLLLFLSFFQINYLFVLIILILIASFNFIQIIKQFKFFNSFVFCFIFITSVFFIMIASQVELGWDAQEVWNLKVQNFFYKKNFWDLKDTSFPSYPFAGTLPWFFFWKYSYLQHEYFGRLFYIFLYLAALFMAIKPKNSFNLNALLTLLIIIIATFKIDYFLGYQEYLIFSIIVAAIFFIMNQPKQNTYFLILLLLIFNSLIWIKNEGVLFGFIIIFFSYYYNKFSFRFNIILTLSAVFLLLLKHYLFYKSIGASEGMSLNFLIYQNFLQNIVQIVFYFIVNSFKHPIWVLIIFFLFFIKNKNDNCFRYLFLILCASYIFIYLSLAGDIKWFLSNSSDRYMLMCSAFFVPFISQKIIRILESYK
ncbi:hypothetical protein SAR11G3_00036 [Candidatus Pelagibacter sp. IMCC9063]|nr:hypothetical protein SAR11G3_00036 [Candidatus Pelagibacter sp. IMCC9063]